MRSPAIRPLDSSTSWSKLAQSTPLPSLGRLFDADGARSTSFTIEVGDLRLDLSRQRVDRSTLDLLVSAARESGVESALERMLAGSPINTTEGRAVGHIALRRRLGESFVIDGIDVVPDVHETLDAMSGFAEGVRTGTVTGGTGRPFTTVVNIGIGGSDLGPRLVHSALAAAHHDRIDTRFVANVDPADLEQQIQDLDPAETLFVVASKTFTTVETLLNARRAAAWLRASLGHEAASQHIVAVSADRRAVQASGLDARIMFPLWEWVGGRYSIGSSVGLSAMIAIGPRAFREMLDGLRDLDEHVARVPLEANAALLMALVAIWNHAVLGYPTRAVIPYAHGLRLLPEYLQQLVMESNGKNVRSDGSAAVLPTSAVIWGGTGTNAQHAFMQQIHQGTSVVPVDFIGFARPAERGDDETSYAQRVLFMNMVAQAEALAFGREHDQPHRSFSGDRPSTVIVAPELTPRVLGQLIALYEYAVFYEGVLLGINSFDQWGVELGKKLASDLLAAGKTAGDSKREFERSSLGILEWFEGIVKDPRG